MDLAKLQALAGTSTPQSLASVPVLHDRTIYLDGDGLAYYCAGNEATLLGEARERLNSKVADMARASGAANKSILLTASGSHKGYRYAVARAKPYQGQRANSRRPPNWQGLRDLLVDGHFGATKSTYTAEADDLFGHHGHASPECTVIATQDKDMRMVPGWHIDWVSHLICFLPPGTYDMRFNDKQFGRKWFWLQMLHGDTADFIPGLPWVVLKANGKPERCGDVTAQRLLAPATSCEQAGQIVLTAYESYYKERALVEMLEQAVLLWMRRDKDSHWLDCAGEGGPMAHFRDHPNWCAAVNEIGDRITTVESYGASQTQDD